MAGLVTAPPGTAIPVTSSAVSHAWLSWWVGAAGLAAALALRLTGVGRHELFMHDDALMVNFVQTIMSALQVMSAHLGDIVRGTFTAADLEQGVHALQGPATSFLRYNPGLVPPLLVTFLILGVSDVAMGVYLAVVGVLGIWLTARVGEALFDRTTGWWAATALALSGMHLIYSRYYKPEIVTSTALLLTAVWWLARWRSRPPQPHTYGVLGLLMGYLLMCNYVAVLSVAAYMLAAVAGWRGAPLRITVRRLAWWLAGLLAVPLACELVLQIARQWVPQVPSYFGVLALQRQLLHGDIRWDSLFYMHYVRMGEGLVGALVLGVATLAAGMSWLRQRHWGLGLVLVWWLLPLIALTCGSAVLPSAIRSLAQSLPAMALLVGWGFAQLWRWAQHAAWRRGAALALTVVWLAGVGSHALGIVSWRSGYRAAAAYVLTHGSTGVADPIDSPVWNFYLHRFNTAPQSIHDLQQQYADGQVRWLAVNATGHLMGVYGPRDRGVYAQMQELINAQPPTRVFPNPVAAESYILGEMPELPRTLLQQVRHEPAVAQIRLYDLAQLFGASSGVAP